IYVDEAVGSRESPVAVFVFERFGSVVHAVAEVGEAAAGEELAVEVEVLEEVAAGLPVVVEVDKQLGGHAGDAVTLERCVGARIEDSIVVGIDEPVAAVEAAIVVGIDEGIA